MRVTVGVKVSTWLGARERLKLAGPTDGSKRKNTINPGGIDRAKDVVVISRSSRNSATELRPGHVRSPRGHDILSRCKKIKVGNVLT